MLNFMCFNTVKQYLSIKFVDFLYSRSEVFDRVIKVISSENILSADLTKGSFGHFRSFYVIKILKCLKFQYFACSYKRVKLLLTCNTNKAVNISDKTK